MKFGKSIYDIFRDAGLSIFLTWRLPLSWY